MKKPASRKAAEATPIKRDHSKIKFEGKEYGKGRFVLAVVAKYVKERPDVTLKALKEEFANIHSLGVVQPLSTAKKLSRNHRRFFVNEAIKTVDSMIAVCSDFGINNIGKFLDKTKELGYRARVA